MKILEMTDELFQFRKKIIALLYEARNIISYELPRIKVRIVDFEERANVLGMCYIDQNYITISEKLTTMDIEDLRFVVWHELGHAYFNAKHDLNCPLMRPTLKRTSKALLKKALLSLSNRKRPTSKISMVLDLAV